MRGMMGEWEWLVQQCEREGRELPEFSVWLWEQDIFKRGSGRARRLAIIRTAEAISRVGRARRVLRVGRSA